MKSVCRILFWDMRSLNCAPQIECMCSFSICCAFSVLLDSFLELAECLVLVFKHQPAINLNGLKGAVDLVLKLKNSSKQFLLHWPREDDMVWVRETEIVPLCSYWVLVIWIGCHFLKDTVDCISVLAALLNPLQFCGWEPLSLRP